LSSGRTSDHSCCWVLDLHLVKEYIAILCKFDLSGTAD
jgi:hypothetical protein